MPSYIHNLQGSTLVSTPKTSYVKMQLVQKSHVTLLNQQRAKTCIRKSNGNACACLINIGIL